MRKGYKVGYIRVSDVSQNISRQKESLEKYDLDRTYIEKASAKNRERPVLKEMLEFVREGDTIVIQSFDRISRSTKDLLNIIEELEAKQVKLVSIKESLDTDTPQGKLMLTMIGAINEFERANLLERQAEGIAIAKAKGKYKGRRSKKIDADFKKYYQMYLDREIETKVVLAEQLNISRPTLDKLISEYDIRKGVD